MGNRTSSPGGGPETGAAERPGGHSTEDGPGRAGPREAPQGPSSELLFSLQALGEHTDHTLLPQSLHQIAEAYSLEEDYAWAVQFLQLERLYHERLVSNLTALQDNWERQCRERSLSVSPPQSDGVGLQHIEVLSQICRTHQRPTLGSAKSTACTALSDLPSSRGQCDRKEDEEEEEREEEAQAAGAELSEHQDHEEGDGEEEGEDEEDQEDDGEEQVFEDNPEESPEEEAQLEWPAGVPQASVKDLVKLSYVEGSSSSDGLVSILKRRRASLDGLPPPSPVPVRQNSKRKVRFSEPEDGIDHDEVGGDSCLILLLLCLLTMVISVGGTALYCALVGTYSSICIDFTRNVDFYVMHIRGFVDDLRHWLPLRS